jgi:hypothetical protein
MKRSSPKLPLLTVMAFACFRTVALAAPDVALSGASKMAIAPTSASLAGGNAQLTTTALRRQAARYVGNYRLKVVPYFFKNETGTLSIAVSDESLRKLAMGTPVKLAGKAMSTGSEKTRAVRVKATPAGVGVAKGSLAISITTENGELVFATEYTLGDG